VEAPQNLSKLGIQINNKTLFGNIRFEPPMGG
jgi:hypothetical protein